MTSYGQFCSVARTHEIMGGRWTILIVRELLCGSCRFNDIRRGIPRISRTVLSERLQELARVGAIWRVDGASGPEYFLTESGRELMDLIKAYATWGQRWLPRRAEQEDLDMEAVLVDLERRVIFENLPPNPFVIRFELRKRPLRFLLLKKNEASLCISNRGFPEPIRVCGPLSALVAWWRGDVTFAVAQREGLQVDGSREMRRDFPEWFQRYMFSHISPASQLRAHGP
jgi:DNA-binding HxlR family transcriptional regulator